VGDVHFGMELGADTTSDAEQLGCRVGPGQQLGTGWWLETIVDVFRKRETVGLIQASVD
jgi:hypothetical protein